MVTAILDSQKYPTSNQLGKNTSNQVYKSQLLANLNDNVMYSMHSSQVSNKNDDINNLFKIYHQNVRGIKGKINELMHPLLTEALHLICLTEHHLKDYETDVTPISKYKLGAKYCRKRLKNGGVCIYIQEALKFTNINLQTHCKEQDIEISAIQLKLNKKNVIIFCVYIGPFQVILITS
jgi:hypothetical protein